MFCWANKEHIKIKNNSFNRNHFAVKGPKKDGSYFGYGFNNTSICFKFFIFKWLRWFSGSSNKTKSNSFSFLHSITQFYKNQISVIFFDIIMLKASYPFKSNVTLISNISEINDFNTCHIWRVNLIIIQDKEKSTDDVFRYNNYDWQWLFQKILS